MRIAFISGFESAGGAARAAVRLHDALAAFDDVEIRHFTARPDRPGSGAVSYTQPGRWRARLEALGLPLSAARAARNNLLRLLREFKPDAISLHNINPWTPAAFGREIVPDLCAIAPVAWRMADMWPVSGCCSYTSFCERGGVNCAWTAQQATLAGGPPPAIPEWRGRAELMALGRRLALVSPSSWLAGIARDFFADRLRVEHITSGIDLSFWSPLERTTARAALRLPPGDFLALTVADRLDHRLKGMHLLLEAAGKCPPSTLRLLGVGECRTRDRSAWPGDSIHYGRVADDRLLRLLYAAADVVAVPSLADNLPGVVVEALACGTPVAGFATGGIPDLVRPGVSGWLAPAGDAAALASALGAATAEAGSLRASSRALAEQECDGTRQAERHLDLLRSLVS